MNSNPINADITISALYNDTIIIRVKDKASGTSFLEMEMTCEQFVNAAMNRLAHTPVKSAMVSDLDRVGKTQHIGNFEFQMPDGSKYGDDESARKEVVRVCPEGFVPDMGFSSQGSFFTKDGQLWARTTIRRWE